MHLDDLTREQLARYIDGDMAGPALKAFAQRLRDEPHLRAEMICQRQVNQSLRRLFHVPACGLPDSLPAHVANGHAANGVSETPLEPAIAGQLSLALKDGRSEGRGKGSAWLKRLAIAAALLLCAGGAWIAWQQFMPGDSTDQIATLPQPKGLTARAYYDRTVKYGFEPSWVCKDDAEFQKTFRDRLGQPLLLKPMPEGSRMLGLDYTTVLTPLTISMLAEADGKQIIVLVDKTGSDNPERINTDAGDLHVFRKQVGTLVMYEITPLDEARVMDFLVQPPG